MRRSMPGIFLLAVLVTAPSWAAHASAESRDLSRVYRGVGTPEDGMLVYDQVVVRFAPSAVPALSVGKAGQIITDQPELQRLAERFEVERIKPLFRHASMVAEKALLSKAKNIAYADEMARYFTVDFDGDRYELGHVLAEFAALPGVESAEPDVIHTLDAVTPNDPGLAQQSWLRNTSIGGRDIRAMAAWYHSIGDENIIVAVADSGVDWKHPDLGGTGPDYTDGNIWINWIEFNGSLFSDDDGNGWNNDFRGWDFVESEVGHQNPPQDVFNDDNDPMDYGGHGTAVSGCIAAIGDNGIGVVGAAFGSKIMPLRIGWTPPDSGQGVVRMSYAAQAMEYARVNGAHVFNCSWGSSEFGPFVLAINAAVAADMVIVSAAGNSNNSDASYLGSRKDVLAVAATTSSDGKAGFSSYGSWVDLSAPGVGIYTTNYFKDLSGESQHGYGGVSGTSFSSPITAAMCAIIKSSDPSLTGAEVRAKAIASVDPIDSLNPIYAGLLGSGRINMLKVFDDTRIEVPEQLPTLTDAVSTLILEPGAEIAVLGGEIIVEDWQFTEEAALQILGGYDATYTNRDPIGNPTILHAATSQPPMIIQGAVEATTVIDGFLIENSQAELITLVPETGYFGGGIRIQGASPTLRNIVVRNCLGGDPDEVGGGGGIAILGGNPVLENVEVYGNSGLRGAGIYVYEGSATFRNVVVRDNTAYAGVAGNVSDGGAIHVVDAGLVATPTTVSFTDCSLTGHDVTGNGGGFYSSGSDIVFDNVVIANSSSASHGGGAWIEGGSLSATGLTLENNHASGSNLSGGGLHAELSSITLTGGRVFGNSSTLSGGGLHLNNNLVVDLSRLFVYDNSTGIFGSGVYIAGSSGVEFNRNTVVANYGAAAGANGVEISGGDGNVSNNIFALNGGGGSSLADGLVCLGSTVNLVCNLSWNNEAGNYGGCPDPTGTAGNISVAPVFCDVSNFDLSITNESPAAAMNSGCGTIGADDESCLSVPIGDPELPPRPLVFELRQNVPNPFNPLTTISFTLQEGGETQLRVYDQRGRKVITLVDQVMRPGEHQVKWDGRAEAGNRVASGIYFYEIRSNGGFRAVKKMGLIK